MEPLTLTEDVLSLTELRANLTEKIDGLSLGTGRLLVTRNGRVAAVLLSPEAFDQLSYKSFVRAKIAAGLSDAAEDRTYTHDEVMTEARNVVGADAKEDD